jgi:3-methyladenine DNA glycosylase/8-oxoguanine DNA glycosylase
VSRLRFNWAEARGHLRGQCDPLRDFIDAFGARRYAVGRGMDTFQALAHSIAFQQLSVKAAGTIHGRFRDLFPGRAPTPMKTLELGEEPLRSAGLSRAKTASILDLAEHFVEGRIPSGRALGRMTDDAVIERLCEVRGIGPWTAQMHLIFQLGRPDVMPATDLGVQRGIMHVYRLDDLPGEKESLARTEHLAPYRSAAAWYFWRASESAPVSASPNG